MSVTLDTSHSPIGPWSLDQLPDADSRKHEMIAWLNSSLSLGANSNGGLGDCAIVSNKISVTTLKGKLVFESLLVKGKVLFESLLV